MAAAGIGTGVCAILHCTPARTITIPAVIGMVVLLLVVTAGVLDVLINDLMPAQYTIAPTHRHRHVVYMLMAIGQVA